jgi:hypothetical protein
MIITNDSCLTIIVYHIEWKKNIANLILWLMYSTLTTNTLPPVANVHAEVKAERRPLLKQMGR